MVFFKVFLFKYFPESTGGFPGGSDSERICLQGRRPGFDPWVRKIPWRKEWQPTPVFLPGEFQVRGARRAIVPGVMKSWTWQWLTLSESTGVLAVSAGHSQLPLASLARDSLHAWQFRRDMLQVELCFRCLTNLSPCPENLLFQMWT